MMSSKKTFTTFDIIYFPEILREKFGSSDVDDLIDASIKELIGEIPRCFKKCCYTLETTKENKFHWQMRVKAIKSYTLNSFCKYLDGGIFKDAKVIITSEANMDNFTYAIKKDVSKYGNHSYIYQKGKFNLLDDSTNEMVHLDINKFVPKKFSSKRISLYNFQEKIIKIINEQTDINSDTWDDRTINYVYQPRGGCGKTTLMGLLLCNPDIYGINIIDLPAFNDYKLLNEELYQQASQIGKRDKYAVFLDFPRAINKERLFQLYSAIERAKDGLYADGRYEKNKFYINCPSIWIFSNNLPDLDCLSDDRWNIYTITEDKDLIKLDECKLNILHFNESFNDNVKKKKLINKYSLDELRHIRDNIKDLEDKDKQKKLDILKISNFKSLIDKIAELEYDGPL